MTLLAAYLVCAGATWLALATDGIPTRQLTPRALAHALRRDVEVFGSRQVVLWALLCLVAWWLVWLSWLAESLGDR